MKQYWDQALLEKQLADRVAMRLNDGSTVASSARLVSRNQPTSRASPGLTVAIGSRDAAAWAKKKEPLVMVEVLRHVRARRDQMDIEIKQWVLFAIG